MNVQQAVAYAGGRIYESYGCMASIGEFLDQKEIVFLQQVSKRFYTYVVPRIRPRIEMPYLFLVLESARKKLSIGYWRDNIRECKQVDILKIGEGDGEISPNKLHFNEVYFQYFIPVGHRQFVAFELEQEAILKKGFLVTFDNKW